jgi:hypothetical protein
MTLKHTNRAVKEFDLRVASGLDGSMKYWQVRALVIRQFYTVAAAKTTPQILGHTILCGKSRGGADISAHMSDMKMRLGCVCIVRGAYGYDLMVGQFTTLRTMGQLEDNNEIHNLLVKPLAHFFCTQMNYSEDEHVMTYSNIMNTNIAETMNSMRDRTKKWGTWSTRHVQLRIRDKNGPTKIKSKDKDICKGMYYPFLRLAECVVGKMKIGLKPNKKKKRLNLEANEISALGTDVNEHVTIRTITEHDEEGDEDDSE